MNFNILLFCVTLAACSSKQFAFNGADKSASTDSQSSPSGATNKPGTTDTSSNGTGTTPIATASRSLVCVGFDPSIGIGFGPNGDHVISASGNPATARWGKRSIVVNADQTFTVKELIYSDQTCGVESYEVDTTGSFVKAAPSAAGSNCTDGPTLAGAATISKQTVTFSSQQALANLTSGDTAPCFFVGAQIAQPFDVTSCKPPFANNSGVSAEVFPYTGQPGETNWTSFGIYAGFSTAACNEKSFVLPADNIYNTILYQVVAAL